MGRDVLEIRMQGELKNLNGNHVHMCPECFEEISCDDTCTWGGDILTNDGRPSCHPVICEACRLRIQQYQSEGSGI